MMSKAKSTQLEQLKSLHSISVTNFDFSSLYIVTPQIHDIINQAEKNLTAYIEDISTAENLVESIDALNQLVSVFDLISLIGCRELTKTISECIQILYDSGSNSDESMIITIAEANIALSRYIEFLMLQETLEPNLLLPIINQLNTLINKPTVDDAYLYSSDYRVVSIANPEQNFIPIDHLSSNTFTSTDNSKATTHIDSKLIAKAYRAGLTLVLPFERELPNHNNVKKPSTSNVDLTQDAPSKLLSKEELSKLDAMHQACVLAATGSECLFWEAAATITADIAEQLPLTEQQKRVLIYLDQQFHNYLPAYDRHFAELVSLACQSKNPMAEKIRLKLKSNRLSDEQLASLKHFMLGPDRQIMDTLNNIIQHDIDEIKNLVDDWVGFESFNIDQEQVDVQPNNNENNKNSQPHLIASQLEHLGLVFYSLNLAEITEILNNRAKSVTAWDNPTASQLDSLLADLMQAENAAINLARSRRPGSQTLPIHNSKLSIYQLDTSFRVLIKESRNMLIGIEQDINDYYYNLTQRPLRDTNNNDGSEHNESETHLKHLPAMLKQVSGALYFLELNHSANILNQISLYLDEKSLPTLGSAINQSTFDNIANVIVAVKYQLDLREKNQPPSNRTAHIANNSIQKLWAA